MKDEGEKNTEWLQFETKMYFSCATFSDACITFSIQYFLYFYSFVNSPHHAAKFCTVYSRVHSHYFTLLFGMNEIFLVLFHYWLCVALCCYFCS